MHAHTHVFAVAAQETVLCMHMHPFQCMLTPVWFASAVQEAVLCVPMDRRLPLLRLRSRHLLPLVKQRFVVRMDTWPRDSKHPTCHFVRSLGTLNDMRCALSPTPTTVRAVALPIAAMLLLL